MKENLFDNHCGIFVPKEFSKVLNRRSCYILIFKFHLQNIIIFFFEDFSIKLETLNLLLCIFRVCNCCCFSGYIHNRNQVGQTRHTLTECHRCSKKNLATISLCEKQVKTCTKVDVVMFEWNAY